MYSLVPFISCQFLDNSGAPLAGGQVFTYIAGTTTPKSVYTDASGSTPQTNPVVLDANGRAQMWMGSDLYKFIIKDSSGNQIGDTLDDVSTGGSSSSNSTSGWVTHDVTDGQTATALTGETVDGASYTSAKYDYEIIRGTTVMANGVLYMQYKNSTWLVNVSQETGDASGVTFSISTSGTVATLAAALDTGAGNGTIKMARKLIPA